MSKLNIKKMVSSVTSKALPAAVGGAASLAANKIIPASINPKISAVIKIVAGAVLPELAPRIKMLEPAGLGFAGQAGAELAAELIPAIAGVDDMDGVGATEEYVIDRDFVEGVDDPQVAGNDDPQIGTDDDDDL